MRKSHLLVAASLIAVVVLGFWLWPESKKTQKSTDSPVAATTASSLEERRAARRSGTMSTAPAALGGRVVEQGSKRPIAGALVSLSPRKIDGGMISKAGRSPAPVVTRTNADGRFTIPALDSGSYSVAASADGYKPMAQDELRLEAGRDRDDLLFALAPGGHQLRGVVSDIGGGPVAFAQVRANMISDFSIGTLFRAPFTATTNEDGEYQLNLEDGRYQMSVFHEDYRRAEEQVVIGGTDRTADFVLTPGSMIEGVVLRKSDDTPVSGALVTVNPAGRRGGFVMSGIAFRGGAQTDEEGRFTLRGLGNGAFEMHAVAKHASSRQPTPVELGIAESLSDVVVYVDDAYTLSGFVVNRDDESEAEPGVLVGAYNFSPGAVFASSTPSASDGYFEIHGVQPGTYTLGAAAEERQPTFFGETITVVDEDISDLIVEVKSGATLRGRITPPQVAQVHIEVAMESMGFKTMMQAAGSFLVNGRSNADGEFELKGVSPGEYTLVAEAESGDKGRIDVNVSGDMDGIEVAMEERASARGIVVDDSGRPVEGVTIKFALDGKPRMPGMGMMRPGPVTITGPDGQFVHVGLEDGGYGVTVQHNNTQLAWAGKDGEEAYAPHRIDVESRGDVHGIRLAIISRNESIRGSVQATGGVPVADAWVTATYVPDENSGATARWVPGETPVLTDESGRFEVAGLRKGVYNLEAEGMRGGAKGEAKEVVTGQNVTIELAALGGIGGVVTRAGDPVSDFVIMAMGPTRRRAHIVADNGEFHLRRLEPGDYTVEITSTEGAATTSVKVKSGEEAGATITLAAFGSVYGTLVDATGAPMAGISVAATVGESGAKWAENAMDMMQGKGPTTDEKGRFNVGKLGAGKGEIYFIDPEGTGFSMIATHSFELASGESKDVGEVRSLSGPDIDEDARATVAMETEVGTAAALCADAKSAEGLAEDSQHLWILSVVENGPAEQAGAKRCDRITSVNGLSVDDATPMGLQMVLRELEVGKTVTVGVQSESGANTLSMDPAPLIKE